VDDQRAAISMVGWFFVSVAALAALFLVLRSRAALPTRLIGLGVVLAIAAAWYGILTSLPPGRSPPIPLGNPALADGLLRLATVLVLGGVVVALLVRETAPLTPFTTEPHHDVPPSV
jgi:hypothetical protein